MEPFFENREIQSVPVGECFITSLKNHELVILHGGWVKISAAASAQNAIDRFPPEMLINLGTCGGFDGRVELGTIILVEKTVVYDIQEQMTDPAEAIAAYTTELDLDRLSPDLPASTKRGLMVFADRDISVEDIPKLVDKFDAISADLESGSIAWVARQNRVKCLILRGVTDLVGRAGGEAYGNYELYKDRTADVMRKLFNQLPDWLSSIHPG